MKLGLTTERREIDQLHHLTILDHRHRAAAQTRRAWTGLLDVHRQRTTQAIVNAKNDHLRKSDK